MARYSVCFDGKWQGKFDDVEDALAWARDVSETDRQVVVVKRSLLHMPKLVAAFPPEWEEDAKLIWEARRWTNGGGGGGVL